MSPTPAVAAPAAQSRYSARTSTNAQLILELINQVK